MTADHPVLAGLVLEVDDLTRSVAFYRNVIGLRLVGQTEWEGYRIAYFDSGEREITLMQNPPDETPRQEGRAAGLMLHFNTQALDEQFHRVTRAWKQLVQGIAESPWGGRQFIVADPDGYNLVFTGP